jgi:hypothetical protein
MTSKLFAKQLSRSVALNHHRSACLRGEFGIVDHKVSPLRFLKASPFGIRHICVNLGGVGVYHGMQLHLDLDCEVVHNRRELAYHC